MLLSFILSFLLSRKLKRIYPIAMIIIVGLVSFFSAFGIPTVTRILDTDFVKPISPAPLSFPFYTYVYSYIVTDLVEHMSWRVDAYSLDVLGIRIDSLDLSVMHLEDCLLYYSFFLLINVIGAIVGYWVNKTSFVVRAKVNKPLIVEKLQRNVHNMLWCPSRCFVQRFKPKHNS